MSSCCRSAYRGSSRAPARPAQRAALDNDDTSSTTPTIFWGKGFGDLPIGFLRPLALTGTLGYSIRRQEAEGDRHRPRFRRSGVQQRHLQSMERRPVAAIQHALPADAGEGLRPARVRQPADACGRGRLVLAGQQPEPVEHAVPVRCGRQLHRQQLCAERRGADPRQQADPARMSA